MLRYKLPFPYNRDRIAPSGFLRDLQITHKNLNWIQMEHPMIMDSCNLFDRYATGFYMKSSWNHPTVILNGQPFGMPSCSTCLNPKNGFVFFFRARNLWGFSKRLGRARPPYLMFLNRSPILQGEISVVIFCHRTKCIPSKDYDHVLQILSRNSWAFWAISSQFNECDHFSKFSKQTRIFQIELPLPIYRIHGMAYIYLHLVVFFMWTNSR